MPELTPRVVFDCNLFVQGIANRISPARKALRLFFNGDISLFVSEPIIPAFVARGAHHGRAVKAELDSGADLLIVDLRHAMDDEAEPRMLPGALRLPAEKLEERGEELPRGKTLVLYCS